MRINKKNRLSVCAAVMAAASIIISCGGRQGFASASEPFGVNMAGGDFGKNLPGVYGTDYGYPGERDLDYFQAKGLNLIRFPFKWERVQYELYGELNDFDVDKMKAFIRAANEREMPIFIDMHNFGRRKFDNGEKTLIIGETDSLTAGHLADVWKKLATEFKDCGLWGYDIMNEPHDMSQNTTWFEIAQKTIDAIRSVDKQTPIIISGDRWSSALHWVEINDTLRFLNDPSDRLIYQAHQYFDHDSPGSYGKRVDGVFVPSTYEEEGADPMRGVEWVKPFVQWLHKYGKKGLLGEYGIPDDDPRWNELLDNLLAYLQQNGIPGTYWAAGPRWGKYRLAVQPYDDYTIDRPQMEVLQKYKYTK